MASMTNLDNSDLLFKKAVALTDEGNHRQAADLFFALAKNTDNLFQKACMLVYVAHALQQMGDSDSSRNQLETARNLLHHASDVALSDADEEWRLSVLIGIELQESRMLADEHKLQEALDKIDVLLDKHRSGLLRAKFAETHQIVRCDRAYRLADLGRYEEALKILEEVDSAYEQDRWRLFYLGYCYLCTANYAQAQLRLKEAIQAGLPSEGEGRAHCFLGAACYELRDFATAKLELELGVKTASPTFITKGKLWGRLRDACICLGLMAEAEHYASLDKGASKPS